MTPAPPKLRSDLAVQQHKSASGTAFFVVKDPATGEFFRLREAEEFIARQFDGDTPLEVIRARVEDQFGAVLPAQTLNAFARSLEKAGLLEGLDQASSRTAGRLQGGALYLRYRLVDPARVLDWLNRRVGFLFTPYFVVLASLAIVAAAVIAAANARLLAFEVINLLHPSAVPFYLAVTFLTVTLHEFGHGLTCRRFGGEVRDMGFMLIYFQPALYCNVSDAWLFPEKRKRLWVGFAGPFFELFVWALAVGVWRVTQPGNLVHTVALIVAVSSGLKTLLNFNPLIKFDGYYLLSDWIEAPNLRTNSFRFVGGLLRRLLGLDYRPVRAETPRLRRIYLAYGLFASVGSILILLAVFTASLGASRVGGLPGLLALVVAAMVAVRLYQWFRRLFRGARPVTESDNSRAVARLSRTSTSSRNRRRTGLRWMRRLAWMGALAAAVVFLLQKPIPLHVSGSFRVLPVSGIEARATMEGIVEDVLVEEGDLVRAGTVVARLSDRDLRARLDQNSAGIREMEARLRLLESGPSPSDIAVAQAAVTAMEEQSAYADSRLDRARMLLSEGVLSRNKYDDYREMAITSKGALSQAKARLGAVVNSVRPELVDAARAQIEKLTMDRRDIERQLAQLLVLSPASGVIGTPSRQLRQSVGSFLKPGDAIASIYDSRSMLAEIRISEKEIADVRIGQTVELRALAFPDVVLRGKVDTIAATASLPAPSGDSALASLGSSMTPGAVLVTARLDTSGGRFKPEMAGQARIDCGTKPLSDIIRWKLARTVKVEFWSWL